MFKPKTRYALTHLQSAYEAGDKAPLENLMRAWKGVKALPPSDPRSFYKLAGYHGEPFRGRGATDPLWWGGYCQHGTVLFPTWHRAYILSLERALQSIPGCADVMLPFWDECSEDTRRNGIPWALTNETFVLDGKTIPNPLRSFVLQVAITDRVSKDGMLFSKPAGYETVRFPLSGLVGTPEARATTKKHNAKFPDYATNVVTLNENITTWLNFAFHLGGRDLGEIYSKFAACLDAPNYTLFSNTTSMNNWNKHHPTNKLQALEAPHNFIHLAVGGYDVKGNLNPQNNHDFSLYAGANGDMGENDTAAFDPIFFFHHCFIDYVFWIWQLRNGATEHFAIDGKDPGAQYDSKINPPPAGAERDAVMSMHTWLLPFFSSDGTKHITSADCINIHKQLGYSYGPASLDQFSTRAVSTPVKALAGRAGHTLHVDGIDRSKITGSFILTAFIEINGSWKSLGHEPVLSRWHVEGCANCQTKLRFSADFNLPDLPSGKLKALAAGAQDAPAILIALYTHKDVFTHKMGGKPKVQMLAQAAVLSGRHPLFTVHVR